jgi:hypothetical protein
MIHLKIAAAAFGLSAAVLASMAVVPASAGPVGPGSAVLKAAAASDVVSVASKKKKSSKWRGGYYYNDFAPGYGGVDTVGSLGYDGWYYAYNRFSGQRYFSCVEDLGYGRVRPCDAGRR